MSKLAESWRKLMFLLRRGQLDRELEEEMRLHAELKAEKQIAGGMDEGQARLAAQRQLGNTTLLHEQSRQFWGFPLLDNLARDVRYGFRGLRNVPGFSLIATLTLALGIGATTAIFSVVNTVLLRPLPYHNSESLVHLFTVTPMFPDFHMGVSIPDAEDLKAQAHTLEKIAFFQSQNMSLTGRGAPEQIPVAAISSDFFSLFSEYPILGRAIDAADEDKKNGDVIVLSYSLWQRRFGGDPNIIGKQVEMEEKAYTIAGVMPSGFSYPGKTEAWAPLIAGAEDRSDRARWMYFAVARLRPGISLATAQAELTTIASALRKQDSQKVSQESNEAGFLLMTLQETIVASGQSQLLILLAAVGFLLLIACANVSNLVLARGLERRREVAVRTALGATRGRIARQFATEGMLLAVLGGAAGLVLAAYGVDFFRHFAPTDFPRLKELHVEPVMALFAFVISAICGMLCGLLPALSASRSDPGTVMKQKNEPAPGHSGAVSLRNILVVGEIALALIMLTGSALMVQSMVRLLRVDTGLRTDHIVTALVDLSEVRYPTQDARRLFVRRLLDSFQSTAAFEAVAFSGNSVLEHGSSLMSFDPSVLGSSEKRTTVGSRTVTPGFFQTLGIPLLHGRSFNDRDDAASMEAIVINESMAKRFFPGQNPVGKTFKLSKDSKEPSQIVGIVADTRDTHPGKAPIPGVYFNLLTDPWNQVYIMVRSQLKGPGVVDLLNKAVWAVDKDLPVTKVRSMSEVISETVSEPRFRAWLVSGFALCGFTLTLVGIYGVVSYSVGQRTHEVGIRMALGASRKNVLHLVLGGGARLALLGAGVGIVGSFFLMRLLSSQLYEIRPHDPATLVGTALLLFVVALLASYVPARRATRVDPMVALRDE